MWGLQTHVITHRTSNFVQSPEGEPNGSVSDHAAPNDDNDGFKDTARGPKKSRNAKAVRKLDTEYPDRPTGVHKPLSRYSLG